MLSALREPATGEWYLVPQSVRRVSSHYPDHVPHRWIVAQAPVAGQALAVLRTTKPTYDEHEHPRHEPGHEDACGIDEPGYLCRDRLDSFDLAALSPKHRSCFEPDDDVIEYVMGLVRPRRRPPRRRGERP